MATTATTNTTPTAPPAMKRRGLVAGAAALVALAIAKNATDATPVAANNGTFSLPYDANFASNGALFSLFNSGTGDGLLSSSNTSDGVSAKTNAMAGSKAAVRGLSPGGDSFGIIGEVSPNAIEGTGVLGKSNTGDGIIGISGTAVGVRGQGDSPNGKGVQGISTNGTGVQGVSDAFIGVIGIGNNTTGVGVYGNSTAGTGVQGASNTGSGVVGSHTATSGSGNGVYGSSNSPGGFGIVGANNAAGGTGILGYIVGPGTGAIAFAGTASPGNFAAYFNGTTVVNGALVIAGGGKSAAVPHPDGTHRLLYCVESPEAWFEDFGEGQIVNGKAEVKLDADFAAVVDMGKLHVFTESHGDFHLHTPTRNATGFTVQVTGGAGGAASARGTSGVSGAFSWRVVAKRKDVAAPRLAKFAMPTFTPPTSLSHPPLPPMRAAMPKP